MNKNFYLTSTLPYVNDIPHVGHALEFVQADTIVRYKRLRGGNVYFNTGTDEHGLKIFRKAAAEGKSVQEYVDSFSAKWKEFCTLFNISYDRFIRTTDEDHLKAAQKFWEASIKNGDIYKKKYSGKYCVGCEEFKTEKDLIDGKCPAHNKEPEDYEEENYFFRFSKYQDQLLELYKLNPDFVKPSSKLNEMISFVKNGLEDFSVSRRKENLTWGVPVPGDDEQVMYVWFDALVNYVTTIGYGTNEEEFNKWWPVVQLCGPDNTRFQSAMWQSMLMSAGLPASKQILVHGMILAEDGKKMSKTIGNVISPFDLADKYGIEPVRYYFIAGIPTFGDSAFSYKELEAKYKSDLQNNFGNLLNRVVTLVKKKEVVVRDQITEVRSQNSKDDEIIASVNKLKAEYFEEMDKFDLYSAMGKAQQMGELGNKYITEREPWGKTKTHEEISETLNNLHYLLQVLIEMYSPVIPESCVKAKDALDKMENIILFGEIGVAVNSQ